MPVPRFLLLAYFDRIILANAKGELTGPPNYDKNAELAPVSSTRLLAEGIDIMSEERLLIALRVLSGRANPDDFSDEDWDIFGFDPYKFPAFGSPDEDDVKRQAESIIAEAILSR